MKIKVVKIKPSTNLEWYREIKFKKCKVCGKLFYRLSGQKYCSDECFGKSLRRYNTNFQRERRKKY